MTPDPYTQLAHHLYAVGIGYPLKDELVDILRVDFSPAEAKVALALPNTRSPLELAWRGLLFSSTSDDGQPGYALHVMAYSERQALGRLRRRQN